MANNNPNPGKSIINAEINHFYNKGYKYSQAEDKRFSSSYADCSSVFFTGLKEAGVKLPPNGVLFTGALFKGNTLTQYAKDNFDTISAKASALNGSLQAGDAVTMKIGGGQHIVTFSHYREDGHPMAFGSQGKTGPAFIDLSDPYWGNERNVKVLHILRVKNSAYDPSHDTTLQQGQSTSSDPTTLNLSPTTSTTNKFNNETLRDFLNKKQAETADNKNTSNHTDNTSKDTTSTNNTSSDKSQVCTDTLPKSDLDFKGEANITTEKLASNGSIIAQTYDSEGNLTNAVVLSSNSKSELFFSNGEIVSSKTTQTDGIVSTKEYSNGVVSSELIQNGDSTTNVAYSNGAPFIATTTNQTDSIITNTIYSNDGKSISAKTLEQFDGTVMSQSSCKTKMAA